MRRDLGRPSWPIRVLLGFVLLTLLVPRGDTFALSPASSVASAHLFSVAEWEVANFPSKWVNLLWEWLPGNGQSREERLALLDDYLQVSRLAQKEKDRLEGRHLTRGAGLASGSASKQQISASHDYLNELLGERGGLRGRAEEAIESELSAVVLEEGLGVRWGLVFPPVDIRFEEPPTILVTSPRDRIQLLEAVLLSPDLPVLERDRLERAILEEYNVVALIDNLVGLSTYPSIVSDLYTLRFVLQTAAHEWLHSYLFFRPLGRNLRRSEEMFTLNETAAGLAGRELGDTVFARMGGDLSISASRYVSGEERDPVFTREMRKTRLGVDELLAEGKVEEAEEYIKERWWRLRLGGYGLRKLNQAYFAFRGRYAEGPGSVSPIGDEIKEMRELLPSVGAFVKTVSGVSSYGEFVELLEELRSGESRRAP